MHNLAGMFAEQILELLGTEPYYTVDPIGDPIGESVYTKTTQKIGVLGSGRGLNG